MNIETERDRFEHWYHQCANLGAMDRSELFTRNPKGGYIRGGPAIAWRAWQASAAVDRLPPLVVLPLTPESPTPAQPAEPSSSAADECPALSR